MNWAIVLELLIGSNIFEKSPSQDLNPGLFGEGPVCYHYTMEAFDTILECSEYIPSPIAAVCISKLNFSK